MQFLDLNREYEFINWVDALTPVFDAKCFINGPQVKNLEESIAFYVGTKHAIAVSSGTDALLVSAMAIDKQNPVVLTTPYTFIATVDSVLRLGAQIIFCDIDKSFNINMNEVKKFIKNEHVDIFIPVHLFGRPVLLDDELISMCKERGISIIEDAAQSLGSSVGKNKVGSIGDLGCFSFFPSKNLGGAGDGGIITTNDDTLAKRCRTIRNHGSEVKYISSSIGGNFRLDTIQAALLLAKLPFLSKIISERRRIASFYKCYLQTEESIIALPNTCHYGIHTYNQYVIQVPEDTRNDLRDYLNNLNIPTMLYYPHCLSEQPLFSNNDNKCECNISKQMSRTNLALPIGYITDNEVKFVSDSIRKFYE